MRIRAFSKRCATELVRDPLTVIFGIGFPVVLLLLLSLIQSNVPVSLFAIESLSPGIAVFGLSFLTLFSSSLIARDRESAFLERLYTTPLTSSEFILGYMLPFVPIALLQSAVCYLVALVLGLKISASILLAIATVLPISLFYISLGLLLGSVLNVKQVGGISGALLTNLSAWLSGVWFDLDLLGRPLKSFAMCLPFYHAVELERSVLSGSLDGAGINLAVVVGYALLVTVGAVLLFLRQMKKR